jgi:hypothetical protein
MVDYRTVSRPAALKPLAVTDADDAVLALGVDAATGTDLVDGKAAKQLDIRFHGGMTFVTPIGGPKDLNPWKFNGYIDPFDCRTRYLAGLAADGD